MTTSAIVRIQNATDVGAARRAAVSQAARLGFSESESGKVAIIVTEAANNIAHHAGSGAILLNALEANERAGLEILAVDDGPGMANVVACLEDGYSTKGTPGTGLGAISRLASEFELHSNPGRGTALMARVWADAETGRGLVDFGVVCLAKKGQAMSGDDWAVEVGPERALYMIADGLGHGPEAAKASAEAARLFHMLAVKGPVDILRAIHAGLRATRGAAVGIAEISPKEGVARFAGVGNITAGLFAAGQVRHMVSHNGIVGHQAPRIDTFTYPWNPSQLLIMHSDGLGSRWKLEDYAGLTARHPSVIAGLLYCHHQRDNDDVTVLAARAPARDNQR